MRRLREARELTVEQLALASGLDRNYVTGIEKGRRNPSLITILSLEKALGVAGGTLVTQAVEAEERAGRARSAGGAPNDLR